MAFRVFGSAEVLSVHTGAQQQAAHVRKQAHRAVFAYTPREGMVYVRSRAISSRCNDNFDYFGAPEIEKAYRTFIGKPVFVNHHNSDHRQARGLVIDAALHRDRNPDGSPDTWVEVLMEVDGKTYPKLAAALLSGDIDRTSMGCFLPGTPITMADGTIKAIDQIELGDQVLTHTGQVEPVTYVMDRHYEGTVYTVSSQGHSVPLTATSEHPFWIKRDGVADWVNAEDLRVGDWVLTPSMQTGDEPVSESLAVLLGYYLAEGNLGWDRHRRGYGSLPVSVEWNFDRDETEYVDQVRTALDALGYSAAGPYLKSGSRGISIRCNSPALALQMMGLGGQHCDGKLLAPEVLRWTTHAQRLLFMAYLNGDGCYRKAGRRFEAGTASEQLAHQLQAIALRIGLWVTPPVRQHSPSAQHKRPKWVLQGALTPTLKRDGQRHVHGHYIDSDGQWRKITKIESRPYSGVVHNFDVKGDDSYVAADVAVHNCDVQISKCSVCGNEARNPMEYCRHIPGMKGKRIFQVQPDGRKVGKLVYEECYGLHFFENSLLVEPPADPTAFFLGNVEVGPGLEHLVAQAQRKAARLQQAATEPAQAPTPTGLQRVASRVTVPQEMTRTNPVDSITVARQALAAAIQEDRVRSTAAAKPKTPAAPEKKLSKADQFFIDNNVDPQNLVHLFKQATPGQKTEGMDWYQHMHRTARMITGGRVKDGKVVGGNPALGAGLLANYSQQSGLSDNHWKASKTALAGKGLWAGNTPGMFAGKEQADKADRMLSGEHHSTVLGQPKTRNFAHLIEHGGDDNTGRTAVCVDRHALSAALGRRINDEDFATANLSTAPSAADKKAGHTENHRYRMVADAYRHAASQLSDETGQQIAPHHVQAVTWVVQRDLNDEAERHETDPNRIKLIKGRATKNKNETARWYEHVEHHFPEFHSQTEHWKMTSLDPRFAYNETKAPTDVNTLRDESCAICGNDIAFDGRECQVCGYIAPPKALGDPDVDKAKQLDQLKQSIDDDMDASGADPSRPGAEFDAGDTDELATGGDNSANPWLACTNCGTEMRPTAPETTGETPPGTTSPAGPAEGDVCPVCQKGELADTGTSEDDTNAVAEADAEEDEESPQAAATDGDSGSDQPPTGDEDADSDDSDDDEDKKPGKKPAGRKASAMKYRDHSEESRMKNALTALAAQQQAVQDQQVLIDQQQRTIAALLNRVAAKDSQIQRLTAGLTVIARTLGVEVETQVRQAMLIKRADEQNPAQPVPEAAPQPPTQTTVDAETPEAFADVRIPGMVPGANNDVAADAVTTAYTPGQDIGTAPVRQLVDVTAPIEGTQGPRPVSEVKTNVDVRTGNPMNPQTAFPLNGPFAQAQRTGSVQGGEQNDLRTMASIRLARLRKEVGIEQGDDLVIGQKIASDPSYSMERINTEIATLSSVKTAASNGQQTAPPRGAVPRPAGAAPAQRIVPPLSMTASRGGAGSSAEEADLEAVFLG